MDYRAADDMLQDDCNDSEIQQLVEEPAVLIAKFNQRRGDLDLFTQLAGFMQAYSGLAKYDTIAAVLQHFPEFRACKLFLSKNFNNYLLSAAKVGSLSFLKLFLEDFGVYYDGGNLFVEAGMNEHLEVMQYLHSLGMVVLQEKLLQHAFKKGRGDIVRYLHVNLGLEAVDTEALVQNAYKGKVIELVEVCFYDFGVSLIKSPKTVECAVYAAACTSDLRFLTTLTDLFTTTCVISSILPGRSSPKKYHFYKSFLEMTRRGDLALIQYCVEVLKVTLVAKDITSEVMHYMDLLTQCVVTGAADVLCYLLKDVNMQTSLYRTFTSHDLSDIVARDWPNDSTKLLVLSEISDTQSQSSLQSDSSEEDLIKRPKLA